MPYITEENRRVLDVRPPMNAGELNYSFTKIILNYISDDTGEDYNFSYQKLNDVIGALECCKLELYRRIISPYEDKKIEDNGDVYL